MCYMSSADTADIRFEARLRRLSQSITYPAEGFFGPHSVSWKINRETAVYLGGMRALLMQLAHPKVAQGISDHSRVNDDLVGRFVRTFVPVYQVIFGTRDQALEAAAIMHKVHGWVHGVLTENTGRHRKGDAYDALDPILVRWVWATLVDSAMRMYELFVGELSDDAKARYYRESLRFTRLMGLYDESVPPDWRAFEFWMSRTLHSDEIGVSLTARKFTRRLLGAPGSLGPVGFGSRLIAAGTLPPHLRDGFHLVIEYRAHGVSNGVEGGEGAIEFDARFLDDFGAVHSHSERLRAADIDSDDDHSISIF